MDSKELHERLDTIMASLPEITRPEFLDLMRAMHYWSANPTHSYTLRRWLNQHNTK